MSMKADLLNPELGYFQGDHDLTDPKLYKSMNKAFEKASDLMPLAYKSKVFFELENEKIWTRGWVPIGLTQQIENTADLLPFTLGFHGVHAQRNINKSISIRLNSHQHGGCRFVPEQCRTGKQTKCSIASCNYTRDSDVIFGSKDGEQTDLMYKFLGLNPDKLVEVNFDLYGPLILVNLDPECKPMSEDLKDLPENIIQSLECSPKLISHKWLDIKANWKLYANAFTEFFQTNKKQKINYCWDTPNHHSPAYLVENISVPSSVLIPSKADSKNFLCWLFPNVLLVITDNYVACIILQATGMEKTLNRFFLLSSEKVPKEKLNQIHLGWIEILNDIGINAEKNQTALNQNNIDPLSNNYASSVTRQLNVAAYVHQKYLISKILTKHEYYWSAPIMDAGFRGFNN